MNWIQNGSRVGGIVHVGFMDGMTVTLAKDLVHERVFEDRRADAMKEFPMVDCDAYHHVVPTFSATMQSFFRYCQNECPSMSPEQYEAGRRMLDHVYGHLRGTCWLWSDLMVETMMPKGTSPGRLWKKDAFCKTKQDALLCGRRLIESFWNTAHKRETPVLWSVSGKSEMLSVEKILENKVRTFVVAPVELYWYMSKLFGEMNDAIKSVVRYARLRHCVWFRGHDAIARVLNRFRFKGAGDISGFDRSLMASILKVVYEYRLTLFVREEQHIIDRVSYVYRNVVESICLLPDGTLWKLLWGNPSGSYNTTTDNMLAHVFVMGVLVWEQFNCLPRDMPFHFEAYADDHVFGCNVELTFEQRSATYRRCGLTLKVEDDIVSECVEDLTYLGFRFVNRNGVYCPVYDRSRLLSGFVRSARRWNLDVEEQRCVGFLVLSIHDPPVRHFVWKWYQTFCRENDREPIFENLADLERVMLGYESFAFSHRTEPLAIGVAVCKALYGL